MSEPLTPRTRQIYRITLQGTLVNLSLMLIKLAVGFLGNSVALVADAVHSASDFLTDMVLLAFVGIAQRPQDRNHPYGHGKFESVATIVTALVLVGVGLSLLGGGIQKIYGLCTGTLTLERPAAFTLWAIVLSIVVKEWLFRRTYRVGKRLQSDAVVANAWDHRSDVYTSMATLLGVGGAFILGEEWIILDPLFCCVVSVFVLTSGFKIIKNPWAELTERRLSPELEEEILDIVRQEPGICNPHNLRTRSLGHGVAIEIDVCVPNETSVQVAHELTMCIEERLYNRFGSSSHVVIHVEPLYGLSDDHD